MPKNSRRQSDFLRLFEPLQPNLERFVLAMTRDREMARDVTAETAMIAYERFETLRDEKAFLGFLFTIASRVCRRYHRHGSRHSKLTREEGEMRIGEGYRTDRLHDIPGIRYVDLTLAEAERLGVRQTDSGMTVLMKTRLSRTSFGTGLQRFGYDSEEEDPVTQFVATFDPDSDFHGHEPIPLHADQFDGTLPTPLLYTALGINADGGHLTSSMAMASNPPLPATSERTEFVAELINELMTSKEGTREIWSIDESLRGSRAHELLSSLVAIRVYLDDDPEKGVVVYWYLPTRDLLGRLPERYSTAIEAEMKMITTARESEVSLCGRVAGERTFLAVCQGGIGAMESPGIAPNPVRQGGEIRVKLVLTEKRSLSGSLYDMTGRYLQSLMPTTRHEKGSVDLRFVLDGVESGPYLLLVETEKGEHLLRRIIVTE